MRKAVFSGIVAAMAAGVVTLTAHHSFAPFDITTTKTITGTVSRFEWTNPHTWIWVDVPNDQGGTDSWAVEGMSPNFLARRGWTRSTVKPGDKISLVVRPMKDGSKGGMFVSGKMADGKVISMMGEPPKEP